MSGCRLGWLFAEPPRVGVWGEGEAKAMESIVAVVVDEADSGTFDIKGIA